MYSPGGHLSVCEIPYPGEGACVGDYCISDHRLNSLPSGEVTARWWRCQALTGEDGRSDFSLILWRTSSQLYFRVYDWIGDDDACQDATGTIRAVAGQAIVG